ncbi:MAG: tRNA (N(6)-L-threonylcarbamoyladenosine(37)-C(2))-methylthiotransferase MtaB [Erysipelotrichaceae bacterium]|nr:tRNA (N(6)-L-threonylcarbamoyladenosine(37)-C(2))-methylthiotransferase MtaB [Erysipelotrichaceae bacterium]
MKFAICNLGCKVNNYEANWYAEQLAVDHEQVDFSQKADIYIINSCSVTNTAGSKSRQMIHRARRMNPEAIIAAVSCYVQLEYRDEEIFEDCDILIGSRNKTRLPQYIRQFIETRERIIDVGPFDSCPFEEMALTRFNQTRAYLKIQDGCNQFCSYCTIPLARGRERSLPLEKVVENARRLVAGGHKEIVLTGIHTGRWNDGEHDLADLMKTLLAEVEGLERIRLSSIEMTEVSDRLIELMAADKRIARHLHIPLQTGNDRLLKLNNRPYTTEQYYERISEIRDRLPGVSISSDIIAGLPTESEQEHQETMQFIEKCRLSFLHVFPYARKQHTYDATLKQVPENVRKERAASLTKLRGQLYNDYVSSYLNKEVEVLFETGENGLLKGHSSEYIVTAAEGEEDLLGQICRVHVDGLFEDGLRGHII